ncbi:sensor histidine kinase [Idiomarina tyrosinivorans]|uniref:histidine kinase n=1 Tax=Idiomarina tyrosinivorans TaxID=1445662 RepID=A0A432ZTC9_9GAMM|nr:sensor histidine kinase [Idiomarina tyrosinivorans]
MPMVAIAGLTIRFGLEFAESAVTARLKSDLELVGRAIRLPISDALLKGDLQAVQANLDSVFSIGRVYGASVYNTAGQLVASAGITERDLSNSSIAEEAVKTGIKQDSYRQVAGLNMFSQFLPVIDRGGRIIGLLQINRRASDFEQSLDQLASYAWLSWGIFALIIVVVLILGHYRSVGRYVTQLVDSMRRVADGNLQHRAKQQGPDELKEIATGLNLMLDSLSRAQQELSTRQQHEMQLEKALRKQEKMAAIGSVASGVAHELGAPLTVIDGRAQRLLRQQEDASTRQELGKIRGQVQRLTQLVNQLLDFTRSPQNGLQPVAVSDWVNAAISSVKLELTDDAPKIVLQEALPVAEIAVDATRMELAMVNLLRNALQAATSEVMVSCQLTADKLRISITDDGEGLPADWSFDDLIQPFQSTKAQGQGTGLGLTIVQQIVEAHGGQLRLHDRPEHGCIAEMIIPTRSVKES